MLYLWIYHSKHALMCYAVLHQRCCCCFPLKLIEHYLAVKWNFFPPKGLLFRNPYIIRRHVPIVKALKSDRFSSSQVDGLKCLFTPKSGFSDNEGYQPHFTEQVWSWCSLVCVWFQATYFGSSRTYILPQFPVHGCITQSHFCQAQAVSLNSFVFLFLQLDIFQKKSE